MSPSDNPASAVSKFYREISDTLRAVQLGQIPEDKYDDEVNGILQQQLPNWDAEVYPYIIAPPDVDQIMRMVEDGRAALDAWIAAGRPQITSPYWK